MLRIALPEYLATRGNQGASCVHRTEADVTQFDILTFCDDTDQWALWSRNRREETEGVYSHETALGLWELSDVNPSKLHLTVPSHFRRNSKPPRIVVLHYADVPDRAIQTAQGFKFTKPLRTILDVIEADSASKDIVRQAIRQAFERGLIDRKQISSAKTTDPVRKLFEAEIRRATQ